MKEDGPFQSVIGTDLSPQLLEHVRSICAVHPTFDDEEAFHQAFAQSLSACSYKVRMSFAAPRLPALRPPLEDVEECHRKGTVLSTEGKDPCDGRRRAVDVIWHEGGHVPVELKYQRAWKSDVYGYEFLKDLHRLERVEGLHPPGQVLQPTENRYAVFLTTVSDYWDEEATRVPESFRLTDGRSIAAGYWVQYRQPSARTRWHDYPPFFLSNPYTFAWHDLGQHGRCLVVRVQEQGAT